MVSDYFHLKTNFLMKTGHTVSYALGMTVKTGGAPAALLPTHMDYDCIPTVVPLICVVNTVAEMKQINLCIEHCYLDNLIM